MRLMICLQRTDQRFQYPGWSKESISLEIDETFLANVRRSNGCKDTLGAVPAGVRCQHGFGANRICEVGDPGILGCDQNPSRSFDLPGDPPHSLEHGNAKHRVHWLSGKALGSTSRRYHDCTAHALTCFR